MIQATGVHGDLPLVSVVMPAYNEALVITENLERTYRYLAAQHQRYRFELVVVDDGSRDGTGELADAFSQGRPEVRVIHHLVNQNLGRALRSGFRASRGDYVVTLDCDLTYEPEHIGRLLDALVEQHAHVALASAYMPGGRVSGVPALRLALSKGANRYLRTAVHGRLHTLTCMVRAYDGELIRNLNLRCCATDINTEIIYKAEVLGARVVEVPGHLDWASAARTAPGRVSSARIMRSIGQYLRAGVLFQPSGLFAVGAMLSGFAAVVLWCVLAALSIRHGVHDALSQHVGTSVSAAVLSLVAVQLSCAGLLVRLVRRYFEELFDLTTRATWMAQDAELWNTSAEHEAQPAEVTAGAVGPIGPPGLVGAAGSISAAAPASSEGDAPRRLRVTGRP